MHQRSRSAASPWRTSATLPREGIAGNAACAFGPTEAIARARCVVAEAPGHPRRECPLRSVRRPTPASPLPASTGRWVAGPECPLGVRSGHERAVGQSRRNSATTNFPGSKGTARTNDDLDLSISPSFAIGLMDRNTSLGQVCQSSMSRPLTRENSRVLWVTRTRLRARACPAIRTS